MKKNELKLSWENCFPLFFCHFFCFSFPLINVSAEIWSVSRKVKALLLYLYCIMYTVHNGVNIGENRCLRGLWRYCLLILSDTELYWAKLSNYKQKAIVNNSKSKILIEKSRSISHQPHKAHFHTQTEQKSENSISREIKNPLQKNREDEKRMYECMHKKKIVVLRAPKQYFGIKCLPLLVAVRSYRHLQTLS